MTELNSNDTKPGNLFGPPTRRFWREDTGTTTGAETPETILDTD
jgi:hypothetical protein